MSCDVEMSEFDSPLSEIEINIDLEVVAAYN
jgi:hypothetical protein